MKPNIRTPYNGLVCHNQQEAKSELPSMTIPDQTLTVSQLMERYARGLPLDGAKIPVYHGEEYIPDIEHMDLADVQAMKEQNDEYIKQTQKELQDKQKAKQLKKQQQQQQQQKPLEQIPLLPTPDKIETA